MFPDTMQDFAKSVPEPYGVRLQTNEEVLNPDGMLKEMYPCAGIPVFGISWMLTVIDVPPATADPVYVIVIDGAVVVETFVLARLESWSIIVNPSGLKV